jgi:hypothetical protein
LGVKRTWLIANVNTQVLMCCAVAMNLGVRSSNLFGRAITPMWLILYSE